MNQSFTSDSRNVVDKYKGLPNEAIVADLDKTRIPLQIAVENIEHDFNAGTIVRNSNAFNAAAVHIIGRKHYNRRGAMCTDKYLHINYWETVSAFQDFVRKAGVRVVAIENNVPGVKPLKLYNFKHQTLLVFGSENSGISSELLALADDIVSIEQLGSTRSVNVGVASGIAMYEYVRQCVL
ncbi:rRNA methyltransferase [Candidatus Saccharibacteria bacterium]|nr:rRNA methyltransferase [Candidatus Saccharibacteria bacterium]